MITFFQEISLVFMELRDGDYIRRLSRKVKSSDSHITNVVKKFKRLKLITFEKDGKRNIISLTKKGRSIQEEMFKIKLVEDQR